MKIIKFSDLLEVHNNEKIKTNIVVNILYIPIDPNWEFDKELKVQRINDIVNNKINEDKLAINSMIDELKCKFFDITYNEAYLVEPKIINYYG